MRRDDQERFGTTLASLLYRIETGQTTGLDAELVRRMLMSMTTGLKTGFTGKAGYEDG